jgi:hypothetical protein
MKRNYRLYANENSVGFWPADRGTGKIPQTDIVFEPGAVPHGATVRVFEVLARDPLRSLGCYCSAQVQQTAVILRHEVIASEPEGVTWTCDKGEAVREWANSLEDDLDASCRQNGGDNPWYGSTTFDAWPYVETTVEVDDDDLEGLDEDDVDLRFEEQLREDEGSNPTWVVLPPPASTKVGPDPTEDPDDEE